MDCIWGLGEKESGSLKDLPEQMERWSAINQDGEGCRGYRLGSEDRYSDFT